MAEKLKAYKLGTEPTFPADYEVPVRRTLNFTDIVANNAKYYTIEIQIAKTGEARVFTEYARLGAPNPAKEVRCCADLAHAEATVAQIIKEKTRKGYVEVKLVKSEVGSAVGKSKIEHSSITENDAKKLGYKIEEGNKSSLHPAVQTVVRTWFGSIEQFVIDTLDTSKCALGQLSLEQINKGRDLLLEARKLVGAGANDTRTLNEISSKYYSNIPMNFGFKRLDADKLRFDNDQKIDAAFDVLDTLEGAKDAEKVLTKKNAIDEQYRSLNTELIYVESTDPVWNWIDLLFHKTRAKNHGFLGKMRINNIFRLGRNREREEFISNAESIAKGLSGRGILPELLAPLWNQRITEHKEYENLYDKANILPLFHGTRTPNFPKIISNKLMMRRPGFTVAGAMYDRDGGLYFGMSSKACNYSSAAGSYWSGGSDNKGYLFLSDVALGKQKIASGAYPYTLNSIKPCNSVWAKGGLSGVVNDEFIVYTEKQNWLRYVIEFESKVI